MGKGYEGVVDWGEGIMVNFLCADSQELMY
jgi:hypothetical protein